MKDIKRYFIRFTLLLISYPFYAYPLTNPITIGYSNDKSATSLNNGRRIARTSEDRLVVVYSDIIDNVKRINWVNSWNGGIDWEEPKLLFEGTSPSLTIASTNDIYLVFSPNDSTIGLSMLCDSSSSWLEPVIIENVYTKYHKYPTIEVSDSSLHVLWLNYNQNAETICYQQYRKNLSESIDPVQCLYCSARFSLGYPIISNDVRFFDNGPIHILFSSLGEGLMYGALEKDPNTIKWRSLIPLQILSDTEGFIHPSMSVDNFPKGNSHYITYAAERDDRLVTGFIISVASGVFRNTAYSSDDLNISSEYIVPSTDDIISHSCAVLWQTNNTIYYGQSETGSLSNLPQIEVSEKNELHKFYPNVCYRTFRNSHFDVIWTEGNEAPYRIQFNRVPKKNYDKIHLEITEPNRAIIEYGKFYSNRLSVLNGKSPYFWSKEAGNLPPGLQLNGTMGIVSGIPEKSGEFQALMKVEDSDSPPAWTWINIRFIIQNNQPQIISDDTLYAKPQSELIYSPVAIDKDENPINWSFVEVPSWMKVDSDSIKGIVPNNCSDTSFVVIASDGDKSDTMRVNILLYTENSVTENERSLNPVFTLFQNYPNPFNIQTVVKYKLNKSDNVSVIVYDISGRELKILINEFQGAGIHEINWQPIELSSGIYLCRLKTSNFTITKKLILQK